jgi:hypothetical protein
MTPYAIIWLCIIFPVAGALIGLGNGIMTALIAFGAVTSLALMAVELRYMRAHPHDDFAGILHRWIEKRRPGRFGMH